MGLKQTDEFRKDAVRIALTSGLIWHLRWESNDRYQSPHLPNKNAHFVITNSIRV